jgi:hypothetical protein
MKRLYLSVIALGAGVAVLGGVAAVQAARKAMTQQERTQVRLQRQQRLGKHVGRTVQGAKRGPRGSDNLIGTITYDPGAPADAFHSEPGGNDIIANRFNSALGGPLRPGNLTGVTFFPGLVQGTIAVVSVLGAPVGGNATIIGVTYLAGVVSNTFNTANVGPFAVPADFMAGQYVGGFGGTDEAGLRNASVNGQGFHAQQMNFVGTNTATAVVPLPGQNVMFRATGNLLVPVELMDFKVQ